MLDLSTTFGGLRLRSPIIAASAPPTESSASIAICIEAGIGAVITKSIVDYGRENVRYLPRRVLRHQGGQWSIQGSFASETLTLKEGIDLFRSIGSQKEVPVIASVGVLGEPHSRTIETCCELASRGAAMIHLDLFYLPQPRASDAALLDLCYLLAELKSKCPIPIAVKLNLDYPAHLVAKYLNPSLVDAVFLLDSVRVPPPLDAMGECSIPNLAGAVECSLFGSWQKPQTLQYLRVVADLIQPPICAGGGLQNADDILDAMKLGASTVQFATPIMVHGADWIRRTSDSLRIVLGERGYSSLREFQEVMSAKRQLPVEESVTPVRAVINSEICINCNVCTKLMFCSFIGRDANGELSIAKDCYGCGFCIPLCPTSPKAISFVPADETGSVSLDRATLPKDVSE